jgi:cysteine synthase
LARSRALAFGKVDLTDARHGHPHGNELVVTAQPDDIEAGTDDDVVVVQGADPTMIIRDKVASLMDATVNHKPRGFFADQFENQSNYWAHYDGTGPEILRQTGGNIDAFVSGAGECCWSSCAMVVSLTAGTGGTIAGTGQYLKKHVLDIQVVLSDPEGSGLFNKVRYGVMFDPKESEGKKRR